MTGAGFGGCAIALVHKDSTEDFIKNVQAGYSKVVGYEGGFFACSSGDGVREIKQKSDYKKGMSFRHPFFVCKEL